jgi:hypothetical protein
MWKAAAVISFRHCGGILTRIIFFCGGRFPEHAFSEPFETALVTHLAVRNFILLVSENFVFPAC